MLLRGTLGGGGLPDGTGKVAGRKEGVGSPGRLGCREGPTAELSDMVGFTGLT